MFPFFTLTPEYRASVFTQIHEIIFFGKGGYDWETIYNMPIWLRKFTFNQINDYYKKEQEEYNKVQGKSQMVTANTPLAKPGIPNQKPTYTSKVSKK